ncbi:MAG: TolC family protein [Bacteroidota bacterium]
MLLLPMLAARSQAIDSARIADGFNGIFPGKELRIEPLDESALRRIINNHLKNSYDIAGIDAGGRRDEFSLDAAEEAFTPTLNFGMNYQNYSTWHREVVVNARVPVKWDNDNPIITNINLPNGGEGIIWLPRPIGWAWRDIPLNASDSYRDEMFKGNASISKKFDFGLQVSALNWTMDYRLNPKVYGFPWASQLGTSFLLPLFKGFGKEGQNEWTGIQKMKLNRKIDDENLRRVRSRIVTGVLGYFAEAHFYYNQVVILDSIARLLNRQVEDVDLLVEDSRVTISESIQLKSRQRNIDYEIRYALNNFIYYSALLNFDVGNSKEITIYVPDVKDMERIVDRARDIFEENITAEATTRLIENHPGLRVDNYQLEQSRIDRDYYYNQQKPDIDITGSVGVFEANRLGYGEVWEAAGENFVKPDGFQASLGVQYTLPLGAPDEDIYMASLCELESREMSILSSRKQIGEALAQYQFRISSAIENMKNSEQSLDEVRDMTKRHADPLFENKRISRYNYSSYLTELQSEMLGQLEAQKQFLSSFLMFTSDMNIPVEEILGDN